MSVLSLCNIYGGVVPPGALSWIMCIVHISLWLSRRIIRYCTITLRI